MEVRVEEVLDYTEKILDLIAKQDLADYEKKWIIKETLNGFKDNCEPGFLEYHKTLYNDQAAVEWADNGTGFNGLQGRKYINCLGGEAYHIGYNHPKVITAVKNQLERQALHKSVMLDPLRAMLSKLIAMVTPGDLQYSFFTLSSSQSISGALNLAYSYTGRPGVIAAANSYHGNSPGDLSSSAAALASLDLCAQFQPFFQHIPFGDLEMLIKTINSSQVNGQDIGTVILEPIQSAGGIVIPPDDYFIQVRDICDHYDLVLIIDETQTGMGRTGMLFAIEHCGVTPDIICLAKALGGGIIPIGAFVSTAKICGKINSRHLANLTNFEGNPPAYAAAIATIKVMFAEGLVEQAAEKGSYMLPQLQRLAGKHPVLKEARGKGLLIGLEFNDSLSANTVVKSLFEHGILTAGTPGNATTIRIEPALTISIDEIDLVLEVLDKVIKIMTTL